MLKNLLSEKAVILNLKSSTKEEALIEIAAHLEENKFINNKDEYLQALKKRESQFSTGIGDEIAIPHAQSNVVLTNVVLIARAKEGIDWNSVDGKKVKYIFSIALNDKDVDKQVEVLQQLSSAFTNPVSKTNLSVATSDQDLLNALVTKTHKVANVSSTAKRIVAITACPTGIAHTYMAADKINQAAEDLGYIVKTETQGRRVENKLTDEEINKADAIILAIDKGIDGMGRFNGKKVLKVSTKDAIRDSKELISKALAGEGEVIAATSEEGSNESSGDYSWGAFKNVYKNLMGGVSRMLPFVVAGGIMLGIAFLLDSGNAGGNLGATRNIAGWFAGLGKAAFGIFVPVLGAYVAYSIVGAEGLMPGLVAGIIASGGGLLYGGPIEPGWANVWGRITPGIDQDVLAAGSGFIGAMVGGYVAAAGITIIRKYIFANPSKAFRGVIDIVGVPVLSILFTGFAMFIFQMPLTYIAYGLKELLEVFQKHNLVVLLTLILGVMMAVDMGGPVNKVAYVFATASIGDGATEVNYQVMAAVMAAGMVPPLAIAFSALIFKDKAFSVAERESAKANWLLGLFFITEGAIPFAAKDPKRVLPTMMLASGVTGLLIGLFQVGVNAPHGGIITLALFKSYLFTSTGAQIGMGISFLTLSLIAGMLAGGFALGFWKSSAVRQGKLSIA